MSGGGGPTTEPRGEAWLLRERVKELDCLYGISRLFEQSDDDLDGTLGAVLELLPPAWQHAEHATACLDLGDRHYATEGFEMTPWRLDRPVVVQGDTVGRIAVVYREQTAPEGEDPFLAEEQVLLDAVAQRLGGFLERDRSRGQLIAYQEDLRTLAAMLSESEQRERRRIAELLHDRIGQALALISIRLGQARGSLSDPAVRAVLAETQEMVADVIAETRLLTFELCPPILYELGLYQAVEWLAEQVSGSYGIDVRVEQTGDPGRLSDHLRTTLFQGIRELLTNVAKHSRATSARVTLRGTSTSVVVSVQDDGVGMDTAGLDGLWSPRGGFGLFNMRERLTYVGGRMSVESRAGAGTTVTLEAPYDV